MKRRPKETQEKYRDRLKAAAVTLKRRLQGKIIPGTESMGGRGKGRLKQHRTVDKTASLHRKKQRKRNRRRKIAHGSKRKNR